MLMASVRTSEKIFKKCFKKLFKKLFEKFNDYKSVQFNVNSDNVLQQTLGLMPSTPQAGVQIDVVCQATMISVFNCVDVILVGEV